MVSNNVKSKGWDKKSRKQKKAISRFTISMIVLLNI